MKKFKCIDCDETFEGETPDETMKLMMPHYMSEHKEIMDAGTEESKKIWMEKFYKAWEETADL